MGDYDPSYAASMTWAGEPLLLALWVRFARTRPSRGKVHGTWLSGLLGS